MIRLRTASIVATALAAALVGAPAATAKPATAVIPASRTAFLHARGTNGWHLQVSAVLRSGKNPRGPVGFFTRGPHHEEVQYVGTEGRASEDGQIAAKAAGLGRLAVRFEQTSERPITFLPERGCRAEGSSATLKGVFRGTIEFHGEGGYTTVERRSAPGVIEVDPRIVCRRPKHDHRPDQPTAEEAGIEFLSAGRDEGGGGSLTFDAFATGLKLPGGSPLTNFSATYMHQRGKLLIFASTQVFGKERGLFSLTAPGGKPTEATVQPPAPFRGTGTFKLESPTTASWAGDLSVEVPTLGTVNLTEPGFWAGACAAHCTKTFPPGYEIAFGVISRLP